MCKRRKGYLLIILIISLILIILLHQAEKPKTIGKYHLNTNDVFSALSPDKKIISSIGYSYDQPEPNTIKLWDVWSGKKLKTLQGHKHIVTQTLFSPDGKRLVSQSDDDETIKIWDVKTGNVLHSLKNGKDYPRLYRSNILFSPDGKTLGLVQINRVKIWDVKTGRVLQTVIHNSSSEVTAIKFGPDGKTLFSRGISYENSTIKMWDITSGKELKTFSDSYTGDGTISLTADGKRLAFISEGSNKDYWVKICDLPSGKELRKLKLEESPYFMNELIFSPDGSKLATEIGNKVFIWNTKNGKEISTLYQNKEFNTTNIFYYTEVGTWPLYSLNLICFSSDGKEIISIFKNNVTTWDITK